MSETICQIEILKDGQHFVAHTATAGGTEKDYKNTVFEDMLTEMITSLQEQLHEELPT